MNARIAAILVVLLVVLGGGALVSYTQQRDTQAGNVARLGQPVLPGLKAAEVARVRIVEPRATLSLAQHDGGWTIAERAGFPADLERVRELVLKLIELRIGQSEPVSEADRRRLLLAESGEGAATRVELAAADGKVLATLLVGKKYFKQQPDDPAKANADGRFVMRPKDAGTVFVVSDPLLLATTKSAEWIDKRGFAAENVAALEVRHLAAADSWAISRPNESTEWTLAGETPAGKQFTVTKGNAASYSMSLFTLADVAPPELKPAEAGLEQPVLVEAKTFDGLTYTLRIGKQTGERHYATIEIAGTLDKKPRAPKPDEKPEDAARRDKEHAERLTKLEERLPRERALAGRILLIDRIKLEDVLVKRDALFEDKEQKK